MVIIGQRYELLDEIGKGGMGAVYQAHDRLTGDIVALKQLLTAPNTLEFNSLTTDANEDVAIANEFKTLARLRHPHIISVLDYGFDAQHQPYFTMNYLENAHTIVRAGRDKDIIGKIDLLNQLLQALAYLHRHGIVHRDLKPANILVENGEQVRVLDFGLAAEAHHSTETAGTIHYMAPEILHGEPASFSSDLYAVGILAYELFSGKNPFYRKPITDVIRAILNSPLDLSNLPTMDISLQKIDLPDQTGLSADELRELNQQTGMKSLIEIIRRLTDKDPSQRYPDALSVLSDFGALIGEPIPLETLAIRDSFLQAAKFVGREIEMAQLESALDDILDGEGSLWLIGGESGVGKSRLLDELRTQALVKGILVTRGYGVEGGGLAYQLWRNILPSLILTIEVTDDEASILSEIVPDIGKLLNKSVTPAPLLTGEAGQQRLLLTIQDIVKRLSQPTIIILEDLQWANESLEPINQLAPILTNQSLLLIGNYRHDQKPDLPEKLPTANLIQLERLAPQHIAELSSSMLGENGNNPDVIDMIVQETEGNTYFMVEVVRALAEHAGGLAQIGKATLPNDIFAGGMDRIIDLRLQRMARYAYPLTLAAIAGMQIDHELMLHLAEDDIDIDDWLYSGSSAGVFEAQGNTWNFVHDKLRTVILKKLTIDEKQALHRQVALGIETIRDASEYAEILMHHWREAGDPTRELSYLEQVAQQLVHYSARYDSAQELISHGLTLNARSGLLLKLQADLYRLVAKYEDGLSFYQQMLDVAKVDKNTVHQVEAKLGLAEINLTTGNYELAESIGREALDLAQNIDAQKQIASAHNVMGTSFKHRGQYEEALTHHRQALASQEELGDQAGIAVTLNELGGTLNTLGKYQEGLEHTERGLAYHRQLGNRRGTAVTLTNVGTMAHGVNDVERAKSSWEQALEIFRDIGDPYGIANTLNFLALVVKDEEGFEKAKEYQDEALRIYREIGDTLGLALGLINAGFNYNGEEMYAVAKPYLEEALEIGRKIQHPLILAYTLQEMVNTTLALGETYEDYLREGLALVQQGDAERSKAVMFISLIVIKYRTQDYETAAKYVSFLLNYDGTPGDQYDFVEEMRDKIQVELPEEKFKVAMTRGETLDIDAVITQTLKELDFSE